MSQRLRLSLQGASQRASQNNQTGERKFSGQHSATAAANRWPQEIGVPDAATVSAAKTPG
jgi:hypothetical protein